MNQKILILFAHPAFNRSRVHTQLSAAAKKVEGVTFNDLYSCYPDSFIDIEAEKKLLLEHDIIIFQHPFYWYSCPPLLKEWLDLVLQFGFAYGPGGNALRGKKLLSVISTGGSEKAYQTDGNNRYTINQFLAPFDQTAHLCGMQYLPPFVVYGTPLLNQHQDIPSYAQKYQTLLKELIHGT